MKEDKARSQNKISTDGFFFVLPLLSACCSLDLAVVEMRNRTHCGLNIVVILKAFARRSTKC